MPKLTRTEQKIVDHMNRRYGTYSAVSSRGHGAEGGKKSGGARDFAACKSLIAKGVAVPVGDVYFHTITKSGYSEHCAEICIKLAN